MEASWALVAGFDSRVVRGFVEVGVVGIRLSGARRVQAMAACLVLVLGLACGAGDPSSGGDELPHAVHSQFDLGMANAWVHLSNEGPGGLLSGTASFALDDVGQFDALVSVDGQSWANERVDGRVHHLGGPRVTDGHSTVETVSVSVGGEYSMELHCAKAFEDEDSSIFSCKVDIGRRAMASRLVGHVRYRSYGDPCDGRLRRWLVFDREASTSELMNAVVGQIQSEHDECWPDVWDPVIIDPEVEFAAGILTDVGGRKISWPEKASCVWGLDGSPFEEIGGVDVPAGLELGGGSEFSPGIRWRSGRDSDNNIIVHFPNDIRQFYDASCWMYVHIERTWWRE